MQSIRLWTSYTAEEVGAEQARSTYSESHGEADSESWLFECHGEADVNSSISWCLSTQG